jgi:hypothetical protein
MRHIWRATVLAPSGRVAIGREALKVNAQMCVLPHARGVGWSNKIFDSATHPTHATPF